MDLESQATSSTAAIGGQPPQNPYETSLNMRADAEAALTYILGCFSGLFFLMFETKNDYVRFNAWQSTLVGTGFFLLQAIFGIAGVSFMVWLLIIFQLIVIVFLAFMAYQRATSLERFKLPLIGVVASNWTDSE